MLLLQINSDDIMAGSSAVRQSKTILTKIGFCDALAAERGDRAPPTLP